VLSSVPIQASAAGRRVTPEGRPAVEAASATKAWAALYGEAQRERAVGVSGPRMFGLLHPRVAALLRALPDADRCDRYCGWEGEPPPVPPMVGWAAPQTGAKDRQTPCEARRAGVAARRMADRGVLRRRLAGE
jgi:F/Y rich C-terminus